MSAINNIHSIRKGLKIAEWLGLTHFVENMSCQKDSGKLVVTEDFVSRDSGKLVVTEDFVSSLAALS